MSRSPLPAGSVLDYKSAVLMGIAVLFSFIGPFIPFGTGMRGLVYSFYIPAVFTICGYAFPRLRSFADFPQRIVFLCRMFVLPVIYCQVISLFIDFFRSQEQTGSTFYQLLINKGQALLWCSGHDIYGFPGIGGVWILVSAFTGMILLDLFQLMLKGRCAFLSCLICLGLGGGGIYLGQNGIALPLNFDVSLASLIFLCAGRTCRTLEYRYGSGKKIFRVRYTLVIPAAVFWIYASYKDPHLEMTARTYEGFAGGIPAALCAVYCVSFLNEELVRLSEFKQPSIRPLKATLDFFAGMGRQSILILCAMQLETLVSFWWVRGSSIWLRAIGRLSAILLFAFTLFVHHAVFRGELDQHRMVSRILSYPDRHPLWRKTAFCLGFCLVFFRKILDTTMAYTIITDYRPFEAMRDIGVLLLVVCGIAGFTHFLSIKEFLYASCVFAIGYLYWNFGGAIEIMLLCLIFMAAVDLSEKEVLIPAFVITVGVMIWAYILSINGFLPYIVNDGTKHGFGMIYHTDAASHLFYLCVMYLYAKKGRIGLAGYALVGFCLFFVQRYLGCRTDMIGIAVILVGTAGYQISGLIKRDMRLPKWICFLLKHAFLLAAAFSIALTMLYHGSGESGTIKGTSSFLSRLVFGKTALLQYPLRLFGNIVYERGNGGFPDTTQPYFYIDNSYIRILVIYGLLFAVVFFSDIYLIQKKFEKQSFFYAMFLMTVIALTGISDHHIMDFCYNIFPVILFMKSSETADGAPGSLLDK